jgi:hypothetical protein
METGSVTLDCACLGEPDIGTVERIARLRVAARRRGLELRLSGAGAALVDLIALCGLAGVLCCGVRPETFGERFGDPGGPDPGEATSSGAMASEMPERAAQELNPEMGRMGAEAPSRAFRSEPLEMHREVEQREQPGRVQEEGDLCDPAV